MKMILLVIFSISSTLMARPSTGYYFPRNRYYCGWFFELYKHGQFSAVSRLSIDETCPDRQVLTGTCHGNVCWAGLEEFKFLKSGVLKFVNINGDEFFNYPEKPPQ